MVKPLTFKGDIKSSNKKRKRPSSLATTHPNEPPTHHGQDPQPAHPAKEEGDTTWTTPSQPTDLTGPTLLVLPTTPPTALSTDPHGTVHPTPLENMLDADPRTAEPHEVRQVWIANRVAGTDRFSFKSSHGKYLSCDRVGTLSAVREAVGPEEGWGVVAAPDVPEGYAVQNVREGFIAVEEEEEEEEEGRGGGKVRIRGDAEEIKFASTMYVRMQARFKPRVKASKEERAREKVSRKELEGLVGRRLDEEEVRGLKRARREGDFHEKVLDVKVRGKHDKFA